MKTVTLCDKPVRVADDELISLTDIWKASGSAEENKPAFFLRNGKVKDFISVLDSKVQKCNLRVSRGGGKAGTWADKLIAYKYASWIDPEFEIGVYTVLDKFFTGELQIQPQQELHDHVLQVKMSEQVGSFHGKGLNRRRWEKQELEQEGLKLLQKYQQQFNFTPQALLSH